ncbi:MAG: hypothetical protein WD971_02405 [Pirellulales bacterium]
MQLHTPDQVPSMLQGRVCRQSRFVWVCGALAMLALLAALPAFLVWQARPSMWISFPVLSFASLMAMWLSGVVVKAFRSTNWLLRISPDGLWINLRSYLNSDFAPAATVLHVPYQEIESVGEYKVKRSECTSDGTTAWTDHYLDIRLVDPAPTELAAEIAEERSRVVPGSHLGGLVTSRSRNNHVPVSMPTDRVLRLAWRGRYDFIVPSLAKTLRELAAECTVEEPSIKDVADVKSLTSDDVDRLIIESVETGDTMGAVKLLREHRGFSLTDAKKFVDELTVRL